MARRRFSSPSFDQINVTPLIDTLFFLLIIFMITAPMLEYSVDVSPPKLTATALKPDDNAKIVNITKDGRIKFEKQIVTEQVLLQRLSEIKRSMFSSGVKVYLRGDKDVRYGVVIDVMKAIKNSGFEDILLITEDER